MKQERSPQEETEQVQEVNKKKHFRFFWINIIVGFVLCLLLLILLLSLAPDRQSFEPYPPSENPRLILGDKDKGTDIVLYKNEEIYLHPDEGI